MNNRESERNDESILHCEGDTSILVNFLLLNYFNGHKMNSKLG